MQGIVCRIKQTEHLIWRIHVGKGLGVKTSARAAAAMVCHAANASITVATAVAAITAAVLLYVCKKDQMRSMHVDSVPLALVIGTVLGVISSFLGIGGGTSNVAMLFFFFSMGAKEAAKNSIFIILFSQLSSILIAAGQGTVPDFEWPVLLCMMAGGVGGAQIGVYISSRLNGAGVERLLKLLLAVIVCIDFYNILKFTLLA